MSELSLSDEWETPFEIYIWLTKKYNFNCTLDVCASKDNTQCEKYFDEKTNGLKQKWDPVNWCNPPRKFYKDFVKKACDEFLESNRETIMLIPANSLCTSYAEKYIIPHAQIYPIIGRINFLHYGEDVGRSRNAYFVVIWRKQK